MSDHVIASRGFTNYNHDQLSFFVEQQKDNTLSLIIEHVNDKGELVITSKISPEVLQSLKVMCEAALDQIDKFSLDSDTFKNY